MTEVKATICGIEIERFAELEVSITPPATTIIYLSGYWMITFWTWKDYPIILASSTKPTKRMLRKWRRKVRKAFKH